MTTAESPVHDIAVTQRLLAVAAARGSHQALADGRGNRAYSYAGLAAAIGAASAGLACRGLRPRDVVGVHVPDAASYVLATHAIRAAGGVPSPVAAGLTVPEMAGQLADCGARMLLTAPPLAAAALAAADRSWVRQVISFGDAPGAISFDALLRSGSRQPVSCRGSDPALLPYLRQPDGSLSPVALTQQELAAELGRLAAAAQIAGQDVVIAAPPAGDGRVYSVLLDHALLSGATVVASPAGDLLATAVAWHGTVAITARREDVAAGRSLRVFAVGS
jgi:acyl-CoA synthetase (AMP-forming)/AMP-acid ligase II